MTTEEAQDLIPLYALGALDVFSMRELERYLRQASDEERRAVVEFREVAALLPYAVAAAETPAAIKTQLFDAIGAVTKPALATNAANVIPFPAKETRPTQRPWTQWLAAAAALVLSFSSAWLFWQNQQLKGEKFALTQQVATIKTEQQAQIEQVLAPLNRILTMKGVTAQNASARIVWDTQTQRWLLQIYDLPAAPADKDYQLWYVTKDAKLSAAVFRPDARGRTRLELQLPQNVNAETLAATAVTLEPKGGVPQPTGKFYLMAEL